MPDANALLTALRNELVTRELVRKLAVNDPDIPPCFVEPTGGIPGPGDDVDVGHGDPELVVAIRLSTTLPELQFDTYRRRFVVDVIYRSKGTDGLQRARDLDAAIREVLVERDDYGLGWIMDEADAALLVLSSQLAGGGPVSDDGGKVRTELTKYAFEVHA